MVSLKRSLALFSFAALVAAQGDEAPPTDGTESICNVDVSENAVCYKDSEPAKFDKTRPIARLHIGRSWCTGWLFGSEGHMITNNHCISTADFAGQTMAEFEAATPGCNDPFSMGSSPGVYVANSTTLVINDGALDFALVKLNVNPGLNLAKYGYLQARDSEAVLNEAAYVIGHSYGKPKRIALTKDNAPGKITTTSYTEERPSDCHNVDRLGHNLDTEGGSSGSPLIAANTNLVIGLHNCGGCKAGTTEYGSNYAVKMSQIVTFLRNKNLLPKDAVAGAVSPVTPPPVTQAPVTPAPAPWDSRFNPLEANTDYADFDFASTQRAAAADCTTDCANTPGCKLFVWSSFNGGTCWLKSAQGAKRSSFGTYAAVMKGASPPTPPSTCAADEPNVDYPGNDIASTSNRQFDNCCDDCKNVPGCKYYVWSSYNGGTCWLKSAKSGTAAFDGARAGSIGGNVSPDVPSTCSPVDKQTDYTGEDIGSAAGSLDSCCGACQKNDKCNAYSWYNGVCYLKGRRSATKKNSDVHSGRVYKCAALQQNTDFFGNDLAEVAAIAGEDCCAVCRGYPGCKAFSFANGVCYLKSQKGNDARTSNGVVSASL
ncbi:Aste57867_19194 [Aphanomyces stellatus]|uniref:Aste57867_19194 protein n=1 Tax=Aphanomyces stellatus TaxID=120398 RepID=A0A485LG95_9STRA|nr:hypothetical protein As57867_019130 [Aphanomyces stellatus]VFT95916.1 Aste57867_19194 [Aphanomyces stellatus]